MPNATGIRADVTGEHPEWLDVLDRLGSVPDDAAEHLITAVGYARRPTGYRSSAATSLAWLGRLGDLDDEIADLPDHLVLPVLARPYLGRRKNGPLHYDPLARALASRPRLDDMLAEKLSPTSMYAIDSSDLPVAIEGLSSTWQFVRRHAAIVLLTVHI